MLWSTSARNFALVTFLLGTVFLNGCQVQKKPTFYHNVLPWRTR